VLKARAGDNFVLGLSAKNLDMLMNGHPIMVDLREMGADGGHVLIFYGKNEQDMADALEEAGVETDEKTS
jgi:S-ribosylhomocysteine lyase LuxS involved in autoinducer biosynthesis